MLASSVCLYCYFAFYSRPPDREQYDMSQGTDPRRPEAVVKVDYSKINFKASTADYWGLVAMIIGSGGLLLRVYAFPCFRGFMIN